MRTTAKRLVSLFVAVVMLLSATVIMTVPVGAADNGWSWPLTGQIIGRGFGTHKAIDISAPTGTKVMAAKEGTVICASTVSSSASYKCPTCTYTGGGYHVVIRHPDGFYSFYSHLSSVRVSKGLYVNRGEIVGAVGSTGNSTGPHLHFAISSSGLYSLVDPLIYITPFSSVTANVSSNDVTLTGTFGAYGPTMQTAGFYIGTNQNNMVKITETLNTNGYINGVATQRIFYNLSKWYPNISKGNKYYYKMYITRDGKEYCSDIYSFTYGTHTHSWNSGTVTKAPTCTASGEKTYTCTVCGDTKKDTVAAKGHTAGEWRITDAATCTSSGTKVQECTICSAVMNSQSIPKSGHSYTSVVTPPTALNQGYTTYTCTICGDSYKGSYTDPIDVNASKAVIDAKSATPGETVTVNIRLENVPDVKSLAIKDITYDTSKLDIIGGEWVLNGALISNWDQKDKVAVLTYAENTDSNGVIFRLKFKVKDTANNGILPIGCEVVATKKTADGEVNIDICVVEGSVSVSNFKRGDVNGDGWVDSDDAIYLLSHTLMPENYPINQGGDFNGDGCVDSDDAIYLLSCVLFPESYPLK